MGRIRLGCSGWDYEEWVGPFYRTRSQSKLQAYARVFDTAEINSSFYRAPTPGMVQGWARYSPDDFRFAGKVPQTVTHDRRLDPEKGAVEDVASFAELMAPLRDAGKLGPLLLQLPPSLVFDPKVVRPFLTSLPAGFDWAIEFRHRSWMVPTAFDVLRDAGVAYTIVDEPLLPPDLHVTAKVAYIRWHGHGRRPWYDYRYTEDEVAGWKDKVESVASQADIVYGYWNNHYHGYAPENCLQLLDLLGSLTKEQRNAREQIEDHRKGVRRTADGRAKLATLDAFAEGGTPPSPLDDALRGLTDPGRLDRGKRISRDDVSFEATDTGFRGRVREYVVDIDSQVRRILHDCEDFASLRTSKGLCKHLVRFILSLPSEETDRLVRDLRESRGAWVFDLPEQ